MPKLNISDHIGKKYGFLTVLHEVLPLNKKGRTRILAKCECGIEKEFTLTLLINGHTKSCGCFARKTTILNNTTHNLAHHPLYDTWQNMRRRCYELTNSRYKWYGAKGVTVCDEWKNDFFSFYNWCISNGWQHGMQIDKDIKAKEQGIEPLLYSPQMCSIVTRCKNMNATSKTRFLTYKGVTKSHSEWAAITGLNHKTIWNRTKAGWPIDKILTLPPDFHNRI